MRLKVDYSGFSTINTQRFGQQFVGKVANPHDMILWHKAPARRQRVGICANWQGAAVPGAWANDCLWRAMYVDENIWFQVARTLSGQFGLGFTCCAGHGPVILHFAFASVLVSMIC